MVKEHLGRIDKMYVKAGEYEVQMRYRVKKKIEERKVSIYHQETFMPC